MKAALFLVFIIGLLSSPAMAVLYVEDFEYTKPDQNDFINGLFHHSIEPKPPLDYPFWDITDDSVPPSPDCNFLLLAPAVDEITFALALTMHNGNSVTNRMVRGTIHIILEVLLWKAW